MTFLMLLGYCSFVVKNSSMKRLKIIKMDSLYSVQIAQDFLFYSTSAYSVRLVLNTPQMWLQLCLSFLFIAFLLLHHTPPLYYRLSLYTAPLYSIPLSTKNLSISRHLHGQIPRFSIFGACVVDFSHLLSLAHHRRASTPCPAHR